jgi:mannose-6-phosphate isomerase class I
VLRSLEAQHKTAQPNRAAGGVERVVCDYFKLEELALTKQVLARDTEGRSFHAITALNGPASVTAGSDVARLGVRETVLMPASTGSYTLFAEHAATFLVASLPAD